MAPSVEPSIRGPHPDWASERLAATISGGANHGAGRKVAYSLELSAYLQRIRLAEACGRIFTTLRAVHRAHQYAIPFENIDVLLVDPPSWI